jgi:hypothetical protein
MTPMVYAFGAVVFLGLTVFYAVLLTAHYVTGGQA